MSGTVVITGGGTGGHLKVADSLIEEFRKQGVSVIFIGSSNGQDKAWFENDKRLKKAIFLDTKGVVNKKGFAKIQSLFNIFLKTLKCLSIFSKHNVKTVISVGGFSAAAATFASILKLNSKLYIHEQNSRMGKLNKITSKFAVEVFSSFDKNSMIRDYPVSDEFFDDARLRKDIKTIAFFGGSQGAVFINDFALQIAEKLNKMGIKIIHQTGKNDYDRVKKMYEKLGIEADVFAFTKDISLKMQEADFAVSRAGASTLWELAANSLPTLFIPYKFAASDHQYFNAKFLEDKGMCYLCREENFDAQVFFNYYNHGVEEISKKLVSAIKPNGAALIAKTVLENK